MEELFNPLSILLHVINACILLAALYWLLYKPVRKFMLARTEKIQGELDQARSTQESAEVFLQESRQKLAGADHEAAAAISKSSQQAQVRAQEIIASAKQEADRIINQAHLDANQILVNAKEAMESEAATLAVDIAAKVLSREVSKEDHRQLIDDFLKKVG